MDKLNVIVSVLQYSSSDETVFAPVAKIVSENNKMDITLLVSIVTTEFKEQKFSVNLLYAQTTADKKVMKVEAVMLKEFEINKKDDSNRRKIKNMIPEFKSHRSDLKFNMKNISTLGSGTHIIVINAMSADEISKNPRSIIEDAVAHYMFEVE